MARSSGEERTSFQQLNRAAGPAPDATLSPTRRFVPASSTGAVKAITSNTAQLILDIAGYFAP
jgi:hypothetical protein